MKYTVAVITPVRGADTMNDTIVDGLLELRKEHRDLRFYCSRKQRSVARLRAPYFLTKSKFISFARAADLVILSWGKFDTNIDLARKINCWHKTVYIDGSEVGNNNRFDFSLQNKILHETYEGTGCIDREMLSLCPLYFRREKPYIKGIVPLPFGIETRYRRFYSHSTVKDIDFVCIFGQDEYPLLRRYVQQQLVTYCNENKFTYRTEKTKSQNEFYKILARSKVGISVGGGGYDTLRFWEILGNNCLLMTEKIDIYQPDSDALQYKRIWQFNNLYDFQYQLEKVGKFLRDEYNPESLEEEYRLIVARHSSKARVMTILNEAKNRGLMQKQ